jgi:putative membrane protein
MELRVRARENVPALTGVLSVVSLGLVFAAALRIVPASLLPRIDALVGAVPEVNAVLSLAALCTILAGVRWARRGDYRRHRAAMVASFLLFAAFLALYLYRVSIAGPTPFPGTGPARAAYYAVLAVHVTLAVVCVPLVYYVLLLAATRPIEAVFETAHSRAGRVAASLWLVSFSLGLVVYAALHLR